MSKPVKEMILADYRRRFAGLGGALLVDLRGIDANQTNTLRLDLGRKQISLTTVKNTLARKALAGTGLEPLNPAVDGPSSLAYVEGDGDAENVVDLARALVDWARKVKELKLKAAVLDGEYFEGEAGVQRLSQFPTKVEAQSRAVQLVLTPAQRLVGLTIGPGARLLAIVKEIQSRLETGEAIEKPA